MKQIFLLAISSVLLWGCANNSNSETPHKIKFEGAAQGTFYTVTYYASDTLVSHAQVDSLLDAFDLCASIYEPKSIISRINNNDTNVRVDSLFSVIFNASMKVSERTKGAFDVTVGQLVTAWGFGNKSPERMTPELVESLLSCIGYKRVSIVNGKVVKADPCMLLDFNAVAQGFSVDYLSDFLVSKGIKNFLIDIGGEVRTQGTKPSAESWVVAIEKPATDMNSQQQLKAKLKLNDLSLATSGNYRKYIEENGERFSHTIDPATGYPAKHNLLSVSVIAKDCMTADAYATAFMVMGLEKTKQFLSDNTDLNLHVYCIFSASDGAMQTWTDAGFQKLIISEEP